MMFGRMFGSIRDIRDEGEVDCHGTEAPLFVDGSERLEESEYEGIAES